MPQVVCRWFLRMLTMSGAPMRRLWVGIPCGFTHTRMSLSSKIMVGFILGLLLAGLFPLLVKGLLRCDSSGCVLRCTESEPGKYLIRHPASRRQAAFNGLDVLQSAVGQAVNCNIISVYFLTFCYNLSKLIIIQKFFTVKHLFP